MLVGRDLAPTWLGLFGGFFVAATVVLLGVPEPRIDRRDRPRGRLVLEIGLGVIVLLFGLSVLAAAQGVREVEKAQDSLQRALREGRRGDTVQAAARVRGGGRALRQREPLGRRARWAGRADSSRWSPRTSVRPGTSPVAGATSPDAGLELAEAANTKLQVADGTVRVDVVREIEPKLEAATALLRDTLDTVDGLRQPYLVSTVKDRVERATRELRQVVSEADNSVAAAKMTPAVFGADRPRRYFLAIQNPAELRATGGIIGNWGILTVAEGKVTLEEVSRTRLLNEDGVQPADSTRTLDAPPEYLDRYERFTPAQIWQNLNVSPDFPTVGKLIANLLPQSGGGDIDGVVAVDPARAPRAPRVHGADPDRGLAGADHRRERHRRHAAPGLRRVRPRGPRGVPR